MKGFSDRVFSHNYNFFKTSREPSQRLSFSLPYGLSQQLKLYRAGVEFFGMRFEFYGMSIPKKLIMRRDEQFMHQTSIVGKKAAYKVASGTGMVKDESVIAMAKKVRMQDGEETATRD